MNFKEKPQVITQTVNDLITALSEEERTTYGSILQNLQIPITDFQKYSSWSDESYTRNCIAENEAFELILLCWNKGQKTPIHDHGGEECWVKVLDGEFGEYIYKKNETGTLTQVSSTIARAGAVTYMIDFMGFHSLENLSNTKSMSLHLYAKPIRTCNIFCEDTELFINKAMEYHTCQ